MIFYSSFKHVIYYAKYNILITRLKFSFHKENNLISNLKENTKIRIWIWSHNGNDKTSFLLDQSK